MAITIEDLTVTLTVRTDLEATGYYTEDAEEIIRTRPYVRATSADGYRWQVSQPFALFDNRFREADDSMAQAETLCADLTAIGEKDGLALTPGCWHRIPSAYGSAAWGVEDEYELARFERDAYDSY